MRLYQRTDAASGCSTTAGISMTAKWMEHDWPPEHGRRPQIEYLPPQPEPRVMRVTIRRQRNTGPSPVLVAVLIVVLGLLLRTGSGRS